MRQPRRLFVTSGSVIATVILIVVGTYAVHLRDIRYQRTVQATLEEHLGMSVAIGEAKPLGHGSHELHDVHVFLQGNGEEVFYCKEADWNSISGTDQANAKFTLTVRDGWLLASAEGWTRSEYDKILAGGLGHDFSELGLEKVYLQNMDVRLHQESMSFEAEGTSGTLTFGQGLIGRADLETSRLNGFDVQQPIHIAGSFLTGETLRLQSVDLTVPTIPLDILSVPGLAGKKKGGGTFEGRLEYERQASDNILTIAGTIKDADLEEITRQLSGGPYHGLVDLDVQRAVLQNGIPQWIEGKGHVRDIHVGEFLPSSSEFVEGRLELSIDQLNWDRGRIDKLLATGSCANVSLSALSSLWNKGRITGNLSIDIDHVDVEEDKLTSADVTVESTTDPDQPGEIDRALIGMIGQLWTGVDVTRLLPGNVKYEQLGARLLVDGSTLRIEGTHGEGHRTVLTVNAFGRSWGIIKQPDRTFEIPDVIASLKANMKKMKAKRDLETADIAARTSDSNQ